MSSSKYQPVESRDGVRECLGLKRGEEDAERMGVEDLDLRTGDDDALTGVVYEREKVGRCCGRCLGEGGMMEMAAPVRPLRTKEVVFMFKS